MVCMRTAFGLRRWNEPAWFYKKGMCPTACPELAEGFSSCFWTLTRARTLALFVSHARVTRVLAVGRPDAISRLCEEKGVVSLCRARPVCGPKKLFDKPVDKSTGIAGRCQLPASADLFAARRNSPAARILKARENVFA